VLCFCFMSVPTIFSLSCFESAQMIFQMTGSVT